MVSQEERNKTFSDFALASQMNSRFIQPNHDLLFAIYNEVPWKQIIKRLTMSIHILFHFIVCFNIIRTKPKYGSHQQNKQCCNNALSNRMWQRNTKTESPFYLWTQSGESNFVEERKEVMMWRFRHLWRDEF